MGKHLDWLTVEFETHAEALKLPCPLSELIEEARSHISASQDALIECGMAEEEAEKQAVQRFGNPKEYLQNLLEVYEPKPKTKLDPATMWILLAATAFTIFFICLQDGRNLIMWAGWPILGTLAASAMWRFKKVQWRIATIFFPATICLGLIFPLLYHNPGNEVKGTLPVWYAERYQSDLRQEVSELHAISVQVQQAAKQTSGMVPYELDPRGNHVRLVSLPRAGLPYSVETSIAKVSQEVQEALVRRETTLQGVDASLEMPIWQRIYMNGRIGPLFGAGWTGLLLGLNMLVVFFRALFDFAAARIKRVIA